MPVARVSGQGGSVTASAASTIARAFPASVSTDSLIVVGVSHYNTDASALNAGPYKSAGTATLGAWQQHSSAIVTLNGNAMGVALYSAPVTAGGTLTISYDQNAGGAYYVVGTDELTSADLSGTRALTGTSGNSTTGSTSVDGGSTTSSGGGVFLGMMTYHGSAGNTTITEQSPFVLIGEDEQWSVAMDGSFIASIVTSATTDSPRWALGASRPWNAVGAFIKEAAGGGPTTPRGLASMGCGR